jgi:uncharacterized protein
VAALGERAPFRASLHIRRERFAICQLAPGSPPPWTELGDGFWAVAHSEGELSLVLPEASARPGWRVEGGWRCMEVAGPLDLGMTGVLAALSAPLAEAGIPLFVLSTYDTDYILVREQDIEAAATALTACGHCIDDNGPPSGQAESTGAR